jgi:hypothetical protein
MGKAGHIKSAFYSFACEIVGVARCKQACIKSHAHNTITEINDGTVL